MKTKILWALVVCFVLSLLPLTMNAQDPGKRFQYFWVGEESVKPSMQDEYNEAGKKWVSLLKQHEFPFPVSTYWTGDNHVMWVIPIENYADIDKLMGLLDKMREKLPAEYQAMEEAFKGTYDSSRMSVYSLDTKYSVIAADAESKAAGDDFVFFDIYYFEPGREAELNKLWDEMKAYMAGKEITQSWYYYWGVMGTDNPVLWAAASAKNETAFYEENAKAWKIWGEGAGKIKQKMMKYVTKQEQKMAWVQKELSYTPAGKK